MHSIELNIREYRRGNQNRTIQRNWQYKTKPNNDIIDPLKHTLFISYMFAIKLKYLYTLYLNFSQSDMGISIRYDHYYVDSMDMNGRYK
jgi:hypothetical protein